MLPLLFKKNCDVTRMSWFSFQIIKAKYAECFNGFFKLKAMVVLFGLILCSQSAFAQDEGGDQNCAIEEISFRVFRLNSDAFKVACLNIDFKEQKAGGASESKYGNFHFCFYREVQIDKKGGGDNLFFYDGLIGKSRGHSGLGEKNSENLFIDFITKMESKKNKTNIKEKCSGEIKFNSVSKNKGDTFKFLKTLVEDDSSGAPSFLGNNANNTISVTDETIDVTQLFLSQLHDVLTKRTSSQRNSSPIDGVNLAVIISVIIVVMVILVVVFLIVRDQIFEMKKNNAPNEKELKSEPIAGTGKLRHEEAEKISNQILSEFKELEDSVNKSINSFDTRLVELHEVVVEKTEFVKKVIKEERGEHKKVAPHPSIIEKLDKINTFISEIERAQSLEKLNKKSHGKLDRAKFCGGTTAGIKLLGNNINNVKKEKNKSEKADYFDFFDDKGSRFFVRLTVELVLFFGKLSSENENIIPGVSDAVKKLKETNAFKYYKQFQLDNENELEGIKYYSQEGWEHEWDSLGKRVELQKSPWFKVLGCALCSDLWKQKHSDITRSLKEKLNVDVELPTRGSSFNESNHSPVSSSGGTDSKKVIGKVFSAGFFYNQSDGMQQLKFKALVELE